MSPWKIFGTATNRSSRPDRSNCKIITIRSGSKIFTFGRSENSHESPQIYLRPRRDDGRVGPGRLRNDNAAPHSFRPDRSNDKIITIRSGSKIFTFGRSENSHESERIVMILQFDL